MVYRVFVEKKKGLDNEAKALKNEINTFLGIKSLEDIKIYNRYDADTDCETFENAVKTVFSEPQTDNTYEQIDESGNIFAVEYLPGQYDQRADSASQCIQLMSQMERPAVRTAKIYVLSGKLTDKETDEIKKYVMNPVESRLASMGKPETLETECEIPTEVKTLEGFLELDQKGLDNLISDMGLAMDSDDISFCQSYFREEKRNPTVTEIRMIDTYWSDHCRHTTFLTTIDNVRFCDPLLEKAYDRYIKARESIGRKKPINLMDMATIAVKCLKKAGKLNALDESEEINACTVKIDVATDTGNEKWLLLFKNETHNHPTEIEPFGGAATCIGGAIRDPLSGRAYVYQAMRVTGAADPTKSVEETIKGKLPQRKIVTTAAAGYSSYGNQIGLATGIVDELYHDGYAAKRMEIGAVVGAVPAENVRREVPLPGDVVILLGGATGRDGCGGATGSSKSHSVKSLEKCGAEVQKGNAPEERKLQRLFRNPLATALIKRCNDFGAGGVSVAIGELADGLSINLNAVPKKYDGLDGTELAISESQERMAVVVARCDAEKFISIANGENLTATVVAEVKEEKRLTMTWNGKNIVDVSRDFLDSNGAEKHITAELGKAESFEAKSPMGNTYGEKLISLLSNLNVCSKRGLSERFDSTIGAGSVLMPFGGRYQLTPSQVMAAKLPVLHKDTSTCSVMAWGFNPYITEKSPYHGAYLAVVESVAKLIASGAPTANCYLTFQEYFEKPMADPKRWGKPLSALLGAFDAQMDLSLAAIGGKDSMSGTFEHINVPPTLVSFAITTADTKDIISPEFKRGKSRVSIISPKYNENGLPDKDSLLSVFDRVHKLISDGKVISAYTVGFGGVAEAIFKMCIGNGFGFEFSDTNIFGYKYGSFVLETDDCDEGELLGYTSESEAITIADEKIELSLLKEAYENKLEPVFPTLTKQNEEAIPNFAFNTSIKMPKIGIAKPKMLIPVFPGTNCEYDTAKRIEAAGAEADIFVINNQSAKGVSESAKEFAERIKKSQVLFVPGGFSGGDEPDGSGKFITAFLRNPAIKEQVQALLSERDGLICGICNGFQALIKLGLVPFGEIRDADASSPTLTYNVIGRHQSKLVRTRITSNLSPWFSACEVGEVYTVPISHGEGRFYCDEQQAKKLAKSGQIATQYVDLDNNATYDVNYNPNGSMLAIEGITSPDGRVIGKMGHSERIGKDLYKNVSGNYDMKLFESAVKYFK